MIDAFGRAAVGQEMLGASEHGVRVREIFPLQSSHGRRPQRRDHFGRFAKAFVGAPPAFIARDGDAGGKRPADTGAFDFERGHSGGLLDQLRVVRGAQSDVVGKNDRVLQMVVAVDGVDAVEQRNAQPGFERQGLVFVISLGPTFGCIVLRGGIAPAEHRADSEFPKILLIFQSIHIDLRHLADLLIQGH